MLQSRRSKEVCLNEPLAKLTASRRWGQQSYPLAAVAALIRRQAAGEPAYLLIRRIHIPYAGQWALVGGKWEFGESLAEAVTREVREETGVRGTFVALRGCVNERIFPQTPEDLGAHFLIFVCEVQLSRAEARQQSEGQVAWFTERQLDELQRCQEIAPTDYHILQQYLQDSQEVSYIEAEIVSSGAGMLAGDVRRFRLTR